MAGDMGKIVESGSVRGGVVSEHPSLTTIPMKLNGADNYLQWSRACMFFLRGRRLHDYVTDLKPMPAVTDPAYSQWDVENFTVMSWLIGSMESTIGQGYYMFDTAEAIWKAVAHTYSKTGNDEHVYAIRMKLRATIQGDLSVGEYYATLCRLWQELDHFQEYQPDCAKDKTAYMKSIDKERVMDFLGGLNDTLDVVRSQVLSRDPFPSVREAYHAVDREETRRRTMLP